MAYYEPQEQDRRDEIEYLRLEGAHTVLKTCEGCEKTRRMAPEHGYCSSCADRREQGHDI